MGAVSSVAGTAFKKVLVVDDEPDAREFLAYALKCEGYRTEIAAREMDAVQIIADRPCEFSAVFLHILPAHTEAIAALRQIRLIAKELPVFVTSCATSASAIVDAMKAGATAFITNPLTHEDLREHMRLVPALPLGSIAPQPIDAERHPLWGNSASIQSLRSLIERISKSDAPVLIDGETGSGKEVLARAIHAQSRRPDRRFLKLNCAALPSELVESELFGYERGAFTGAFQRKTGMFELADGGTLLLDEIGDMDYKIQAKLLQVLQDHEFQRLGGRETIHVDVRVIAATHRDLPAAIRYATFREDLYYRLNVINIRVPPLRERKEDIGLLAHRFLQKHADGKPVPALTPALQHAMMEYDWPGNVRELENLMRRFVIFRDPVEMIEELRGRIEHIPVASAARQPASRNGTVPGRSAVAAIVPAGAAAQGTANALDGPRVRDPRTVYHPTVGTGGEPTCETRSILLNVAKANQYAEASAILEALDRTHWNRKRAARLLGIDYKALLYKMKKLSVSSSDLRARGAGA